MIFPKPRLDDSFQCPYHFPAMLLLAQLFALASRREDRDTASQLGMKMEKHEKPILYIYIQYYTVYIYTIYRYRYTPQKMPKKYEIRMWISRFLLFHYFHVSLVFVHLFLGVLCCELGMRPPWRTAPFMGKLCRFAKLNWPDVIAT